MSTTVWIILASAVATYLTRIGGYLVLSRFKRIHPRVDAGLRAVPAAVLATLVVPPAVTNGPAEAGAMVIAGLVALRLPGLAAFAAGWLAIIALRQVL